MKRAFPTLVVILCFLLQSACSLQAQTGIVFAQGANPLGNLWGSANHGASFGFPELPQMFSGNDQDELSINSMSFFNCQTPGDTPLVYFLKLSFEFGEAEGLFHFWTQLDYLSDSLGNRILIMRLDKYERNYIAPGLCSGLHLSCIDREQKTDGEQIELREDEAECLVKPDQIITRKPQDHEDLFYDMDSGKYFINTEWILGKLPMLK